MSALFFGWCGTRPASRTSSIDSFGTFLLPIERTTARRATYVGLALLTIAIGLLVHTRGVLEPTARDILGDAVWATMIVWWISAIGPNALRRQRAGVAYVICVAVELSQRYHQPALDAIRATRVGHLVLGSGFDPRDLGAYALGVAAAAMLDALLSRRSRSVSRTRDVLEQRT
jgi:hypothetical protein